MLTACFCRKLPNHTLFHQNNNRNHISEQYLNSTSRFTDTKKPNPKIWLLIKTNYLPAIIVNTQANLLTLSSRRYASIVVQIATH